MNSGCCCQALLYREQLVEEGHVAAAAAATATAAATGEKWPRRCGDERAMSDASDERWDFTSFLDQIPRARRQVGGLLRAFSHALAFVLFVVIDKTQARRLPLLPLLHIIIIQRIHKRSSRFIHLRLLPLPLPLQQHHHGTGSWLARAVAFYGD